MKHKIISENSNLSGMENSEVLNKGQAYLASEGTGCYVLKSKLWKYELQCRINIRVFAESK